MKAELTVSAVVKSRRGHRLANKGFCNRECYGKCQGKLADGTLCDSAAVKVARNGGGYYSYCAQDGCKRLRVAQPKRWIQCLNRPVEGGPICGVKKYTKVRKGGPIKCTKCKQQSTVEWRDPCEAP